MALNMEEFCRPKIMEVSQCIQHTVRQKLRYLNTNETVIGASDSKTQQCLGDRMLVFAKTGCGCVANEIAENKRTTPLMPRTGQGLYDHEGTIKVCQMSLPAPRPFKITSLISKSMEV
jgi:hypothetical protein